MSSGLAAKLPLTVDNTFGAYNLITDFEELALQNLKMIVLTAPGERMMDPDFGVGVRNYLFSLNITQTYETIRHSILQQVQRYLPFITIHTIDFATPENNPDLFPNTLWVVIHFEIPQLKMFSVLQVNVDNN
jgi:phage baseplate assembly protein W